MATTDGRLVKGEARRKNLVEAALGVFAERGFTRATIKDIGKAAGMSPALLYHYFQSKDELLDAVVEQYGVVDNMRYVVDQLQSEPPEEFLKVFACRLYDLIGERMALVRIFLQESYSNKTVAEAWRRLLLQGMPLIKSYFERQIVIGLIRPHNVEVTMRTLAISIIMLRFTEPVFPPQTATGHEYIRQLVANLYLGIKPD